MAALALLTTGGAFFAQGAGSAPDLSDPEAFVMGLVRASIRETNRTRKAMENYAFHERLHEFEHRKDGALEPAGVVVSWNYYSKKYEAFRSVPLTHDGRETTLAEREKHARKEEKNLENLRREREKAKAEKEREKEKKRLAAEREAAKKKAAAPAPKADSPAPPPSGNANSPQAQQGQTPPAPAAEKGKSSAAGQEKPRRMDEGRAREVAERHATPTEGLDEAAKASVSLGWVEISVTDIARHFAFFYEGEGEHEGEPVHIVRYRKRLDVEEPKREIRKAVPPVEGRLWISRRENAVVRMDMELMDDVRYRPKTGFNVKEVRFSLYAKKVDGKHWFESEVDYAVNASAFGVFRFHEHGEIRRSDFKVFTVETKEGAPSGGVQSHAR